MTERQCTDELVLRETFRATPDQVFAWMTEPARLVMWWGPDGFSTPEALFDPVVGGGYRLTMQPPEGSPFHLAGAFLAVHPPLRLRYTFRWEEPLPDDRETVVDLDFHRVGGGTEVVLSQHGFASRERLELHRDGWTQAFGRLRALIDSPPPAS
jgi:uncharacterized protein YndB with AHSA1/START domain